MAMGRPKATLVLDSELREELESLANSRSLPAGLEGSAVTIDERISFFAPDLPASGPNCA